MLVVSTPSFNKDIGKTKIKFLPPELNKSY